MTYWVTITKSNTNTDIERIAYYAYNSFNKHFYVYTDQWWSFKLTTELKPFETATSTAASSSSRPIHPATQLALLEHIDSWMHTLYPWGTDVCRPRARWPSTVDAAGIEWRVVSELRRMRSPPTISRCHTNMYPIDWLNATVKIQQYDTISVTAVSGTICLEAFLTSTMI